ncbi:putative transcription factor interactor and regulator CCHC(Zn) family [Helianthus anomalus]
MDIKRAFASVVRRAKDFMERTCRTSLESNKDTKYRFDKKVVKCFYCGERGHFKRECTKPAKHDTRIHSKIKVTNRVRIRPGIRSVP